MATKKEAMRSISKSILVIAIFLFFSATTVIAQTLKIKGDSIGVILESKKQIGTTLEQDIPIILMSNGVGINKSNPECALDVNGAIFANSMKLTNCGLGCYSVGMYSPEGHPFAIPDTAFEHIQSLKKEGRVEEANALIAQYDKGAKYKIAPEEETPKQLVLEVRAFPNPCENVVEVKSNMDSKKRKVSISDINGEKICDATYSPNEPIILSTTPWNKGLYIIKVKSSGLTQTTKIIKQ